MDLDTLIDQTEVKMQSVSAGMDVYAEAIQEYRATFDETLSVINESTERAQQSISENLSLLNQMTDTIGSLGEAANSQIDELDQKLAEFTAKAESIEQEITARVIAYSESLATTTQSALDASQSLIATSTNYTDLIQSFEDNFNDTTTAVDQLKDALLTTIGSTVETATGGFEGSVENLTSLKDLCSTKANELLEQFKSMVEVSESLSQDLLDGTKALNGDKLALVESLIGSDIVEKITEGSSTLKDAAETLRSMGLDDIERYVSSIDDVLGYTDKVNDIYDSIKPLIDLIT